MMAKMTMEVKPCPKAISQKAGVRRASLADNSCWRGADGLAPELATAAERWASPSGTSP